MAGREMESQAQFIEEQSIERRHQIITDLISDITIHQLFEEQVQGRQIM